jgi:hypothetical protein
VKIDELLHLKILDVDRMVCDAVGTSSSAVKEESKGAYCPLEWSLSQFIKPKKSKREILFGEVVSELERANCETHLGRVNSAFKDKRDFGVFGFKETVGWKSSILEVKLIFRDLRPEERSDLSQKRKIAWSLKCDLFEDRSGLFWQGVGDDLNVLLWKALQRLDVCIQHLSALSANTLPASQQTFSLNESSSEKLRNEKKVICEIDETDFSFQTPKFDRFGKSSDELWHPNKPWNQKFHSMKLSELSRKIQTIYPDAEELEWNYGDITVEEFIRSVNGRKKCRLTWKLLSTELSIQFEKEEDYFRRVWVFGQKNKTFHKDFFPNVLLSSCQSNAPVKGIHKPLLCRRGYKTISLLVAHLGNEIVSDANNLHFVGTFMSCSFLSTVLILQEEKMKARWKIKLPRSI